MNSDAIEKLRLVPGALTDSTSLTQKPNRYKVEGLENHLQAEIRGTTQSLYWYRLTRVGDQIYEPLQGKRTPEEALEALKRLLTWEPFR